MSAETVNQNDVKSYVQITSLNGSYYFAWISSAEAYMLVQDYYVVEPAKCAPRTESPRRQITEASTEDMISETCFMLAHNMFGDTGEEAEMTDSDHYSNGMRMTLETLVESLGQRLLEPPTKATEGLIEMWTKRMIQKFHTYDVIAAKRQNGAN